MFRVIKSNMRKRTSIAVYKKKLVFALFRLVQGIDYTKYSFIYLLNYF